MELQEGTLFDGRYLLKEWIGAGAYGEVWLALDKQTDVEVAIKIYVSMDAKGLDDFKKEFKVSFDLNHTNLLHANYLEVSKQEQRPYLVMPYCPNGSAMKLMGNISEDEMWKYIRDVASGLAYLHSQNPPIIHQDIKPDNILLTRSGEFVITDFGISQQARSTLRRSVKHLNSAGSVAYMGPERYGKEYHAIKASDIWSFGVTIFELAMGDLPFCGLGGSLQRQGAEIPDLSDEYSDDLNIVMRSCLAKDTWDRPTAQMLSEYAAQKVAGKNVPIPWLNDEESSEEDQEIQKSTITTSKSGKAEKKDSEPVSSSLESDTILLKNKPEKDTVKINTAMDSDEDSSTANKEPATIVNSELPTKKGIKWYIWLLAVILGFSIGVVLNLFNII